MKRRRINAWLNGFMPRVAIAHGSTLPYMRRIRDPKSVRLKYRDYDVTPNIIAHMYPQLRNGSVKECEVEMVGEECEVYCEDV